MEAINELVRERKREERRDKVMVGVSVVLRIGLSHLRKENSKI